jgi:hypothetical protein
MVSKENVKEKKLNSNLTVRLMTKKDVKNNEIKI